MAGLVGVWSRCNRDYLKESAEETSAFAIKRSLVDSRAEQVKQAKQVTLFYGYGTVFCSITDSAESSVKSRRDVSKAPQGPSPRRGLKLFKNHRTRGRVQWYILAGKTILKAKPYREKCALQGGKINSPKATGRRDERSELLI